MKTYNPDNVTVSLGGIEVNEWVGNELLEIKQPNITFRDLAEYPKDHPDYKTNVVVVSIRKVFDEKGNSHSIDVPLYKNSEQLKEFLALDPYDTTSITVRSKDCENT